MPDVKAVRAAYRAALEAVLKEAQARGDMTARQRALLMLSLHDQDFPIAKLDLPGKAGARGM